MVETLCKKEIVCCDDNEGDDNEEVMFPIKENK